MKEEREKNGEGSREGIEMEKKKRKKKKEVKIERSMRFQSLSNSSPSLPVLWQNPFISSVDLLFSR